jgi:tRNA dimethylallyltransferase
VRAWEVLEATGRPLASWQRHAGEPVLKGLKPARIVLDQGRALLRERIRLRFLAMLEAGALAEAVTLTDLDPALPAAKILGLRPLQALAAGALTRPQAVGLAVTATCQFAKRQATWFRHRMADWNWVQPDLDGNFVSSVRQVIA